MLSPAVCLALALSLCAAVASAAHAGSSAFLYRDTVEQIIANYTPAGETEPRLVTCSLRVLRPGHEATVEQISTSFNRIFELTDRIAALGKLYNITRSRGLIRKKSFSLAVEDNFHVEEVSRLSQLESYAITLYFFNATEPQDALCFEFFAAQRRFDVVLPFFTATSRTLMKRHDLSKLQSHFGIPFIMPPSTEIIERFTNKTVFAEWIGQHMPQFMPHTYTVDSAVFPCVVKKSTGMFGNGISIVNSHEELEEAVGGLTNEGDSYVIQEAIPGTVEYATIFSAARGEILGAICGFVHYLYLSSNPCIPIIYTNLLDTGTA